MKTYFEFAFTPREIALPVEIVWYGVWKGHVTIGVRFFCFLGVLTFVPEKKSTV